MLNHASTHRNRESALRNLVGDKYLYSFQPGLSLRTPRRYVFTDGVQIGYHNALRHAEALFHASRNEET
jgi:hypothetical protein